MGLKEEVAEMKKEVKEVQSHSLAMELLHDAKKANRRLFIITLVVLTMWFITIGYVVYLLNDIGTVETTTTQKVSDVDTIENSNFTNGDLYGEDSTNKNN